MLSHMSTSTAEGLKGGTLQWLATPLELYGRVEA